MKTLLLFIALVASFSAWSLDIRRVPFCEGFGERRIPAGFIGTYQKLRNTFVLTAEGVQQVPDIRDLTSSDRSRIPEDQIERGFCKQIHLISYSHFHALSVNLIHTENTWTGYNSHTYAYRLNYNQRTNEVMGGYQSARHGMFLWIIPGGSPANVHMLPYRKL